METHLHSSSSSGTTLEMPSWVWGLTKSFRAWQYVVKRLCCFQRPKTCRDDSKFRHLGQGVWLVWLTWSCWSFKKYHHFSSSLSLAMSSQGYGLFTLLLQIWKKKCLPVLRFLWPAIFPISSSNSRRAGLAMDVVLEEIHGRQHVVHEALMHPHFMDWLRQSGQ